MWQGGETGGINVPVNWEDHNIREVLTKLLFTVNTERCTCTLHRSPKHVRIKSVSRQKELKWMKLLKYGAACAFVRALVIEYAD